MKKLLLLFFMSSLFSAPSFGKSGEIICAEMDTKEELVFPIDLKKHISVENAPGEDYYELRIGNQVYQCDEIGFNFDK